MVDRIQVGQVFIDATLEEVDPNPWEGDIAWAVFALSRYLELGGAAGDADFLAALKATEKLKQKYPDICIEIGMSGEFILGLHGDLAYNGKRLAGLYAHDQVELAQQAGAPSVGLITRNPEP